MCIERQPKALIAKHSDILTNLFLKMFDLRRIQFSPRTDDSYEDKEIEDIESAISTTFMAMIYKINDAVFRPIFTRFVDWCTSPTLKDNKNPITQRQITSWTFLLHFFRTLKSIVTNYAGLVIGEAIEILKKTSFDDSDSRLRWDRVMLTLQSTFEHDQDGFFQPPSHFWPLCESLLAQLPPTATSRYSSTLLPEVISALTLLAGSTDAQAHHKELCGPLLQYLRNDSPAVRLAAVKTQLSLTEQLGEEWLGLLPEMLPFIGEGLEDDDEAVEMEMRIWAKRIEEILGESIEPMLQ